MALYECVDCGNKLSPTAPSCNKCNSTDPFGRKRKADQVQAIMMLIGLVIVVVVFFAFKNGFLTWQMVKDFLHYLGK